MNATDAESGPVLYAEPGATWWPVLWGPAFALAGVVVELTTPGMSNIMMWLLVAAILAGGAALWVYGRRRVCCVRLTPSVLVLGREELATDRIAAVRDVGTPVGARVLGGGWVAPKGTAEVPLRLTDDTVVLAWARDPGALSGALQSLIGED